MGLVTDYLIQLIQRQVTERALVVWCDPAGVYADLAARLTLPETRVALFGGSYLGLRRSVDETLNDLGRETPPRLLLYFPHELASAQHALDEFVAGGGGKEKVMRPSANARPLNTSLDVVARHALKSVLAPEKVEAVCEQIRKGQITSLAELDRLAEQGTQAGVLSLLFGQTQPADLALEFLAHPAHDAALAEKAAGPELAALLAQTFGALLPSTESPAQIRDRLRQHVLVTEFRASSAGASPAPLETVPYPGGPHREACVTLARTWRNRRDLQASYAEAARQVEDHLGASQWPLNWNHLRAVETFPSVETCLQAGVEAALVQVVTPDLLALAQERQANLWADLSPLTVKNRWHLIATAGRLLMLAEKILTTLRIDPPPVAAEYVARYTDGPEAWCRLDTEHRRLERLVLSLDFDPLGGHATLEQLLARARQQYHRAVDTLARQFIAALEQAQFQVGEVLLQTDVFARHVAPARALGKTAYVLVDALRYEMARELADNLNPLWRVELHPALGTPPTITPVGMVALLPGAERGLALVNGGARGVQAAIGGRVFKDRADRLRYLAEHVEGMCDVKLEELTPAKKSVREKIKAASFVLVTSQEIDLLGEKDTPAQAREFMDSALGKLARAFHVLAELGVQRLVVAADHGYLFGDELEADRTLPAPGGQTVDLHRRVWVGQGGQMLAEAVRLSAQSLNLGGDLEIVTPYGLAGFAGPGGRAYVHGGLSLQEFVIPVLNIQPTSAPVTARLDWAFTPTRPKITTRLFSLVVGGQAVGMFNAIAPRVRVEVQAYNRPIETLASATYGFNDTTREIEMRFKPEPSGELEPNTVTVMLPDNFEPKRVTVVLVDAQSEQTLNKTEMDVALAF